MQTWMQVFVSLPSKETLQNFSDIQCITSANRILAVFQNVYDYLYCCMLYRSWKFIVINCCHLIGQGRSFLHYYQQKRTHRENHWPFTGYKIFCSSCDLNLCGGRQVIFEDVHLTTQNKNWKVLEHTALEKHLKHNRNEKMLNINSARIS